MSFEIWAVIGIITIVFLVLSWFVLGAFVENS